MSDRIAQHFLGRLGHAHIGACCDISKFTWRSTTFSGLNSYTVSLHYRLMSKIDARPDILTEPDHPIGGNRGAAYKLKNKAITCINEV